MHDNLLPICLIFRWGNPIPGWEPKWVEAPMWTRPSTTYPSHLLMGFLPYLDEQSYLGKSIVILSVISPSQGGMCSFLLQFFRESIQISPWEEAWWEHLQYGHLSEYTVARPHLSTPYHVWSDTESLCALTCHEIQDSLTSTHNSGYNIESQLALESSQTILQEVYESKLLLGLLN